MTGHEYDVANVCAECKGPLRHPVSGCYHEQLLEGVGYAGKGHAGVEPICCGCKGHIGKE